MNGTRLRVLSVACVFPNPVEPRAGLFVRNRLLALSYRAAVRVAAPVALISYQRFPKRWLGAQGAPSRSKEGEIEVIHPRWIYPPAGGAWNSVFLFLFLLCPLSRLRSSFPFQTIDAQFGYPEGFATALLAWWFGCPYTVTLRGSEVFHAQRRLRGAFLQWAMRRAGCVITVSERLRQFALGVGVAADRVRTIPNGVDAGIFHPRDRRECRRKYGIAGDARAILSAGHLTELKGHHRIVRALARMRDSGMKAELLIAGGTGSTAGYEAEIRREIAALGLEDRVRLLGELPPESLAEAMAAADVFCLASRSEGWPNVVNEALSCGTPVVATDVGAVPEMIVSPAYGKIVPPGNVEALEKALREALQAHWDREAIAQWGRSRSWEHVAAEVEETLREVISRHGR
jgi:glycosyltransferase involved in cell wall biosynthesis